VTWDCGYCSRGFVHENAFMKHRCPERDRIEELRGPIGQAAYASYAAWMKAKKHSVPPIDTFATSKSYGTFIRFAKHVTRVHIPNVEAFIRFMVESDVPPVLWTKDNIFSMYLRLYDDAVHPTEQVARSQELLAELILELKVEPAEIYETLGVDTLEELLKRRKLSAWFLMASQIFRRFLQGLPAEDRDRLSNALHLGAAIVRFSQEPEMFARFGVEAASLGL
jgi:hypothetical protein